MTGARDRNQLRWRRYECECGCHLSYGAEAILHSVYKKCRHAQIWEMSRAQIIWLLRRMQRIREQQQSLSDGRLLSRQHRSHAPSIRMAAQDHARSVPRAQRLHRSL